MREYQMLLGRKMPFGQKTPVEGTALRLEDYASLRQWVTLSRWNLVAEDPMSNARGEYTRAAGPIIGPCAIVVGHEVGPRGWLLDQCRDHPYMPRRSEASAC
jgi:hypothetical protein